MAPTMDFSQGTHPKVMIAPPRLNLRRAASYQGEKAPTSSTSSRFNFNHLIFSSPPPSPGLPALVPRPRKSSSAPRPSRVLRVLVWTTGLAAFLLLIRALIHGGKRIPVVGWAFEDGEGYEMVRQNELPEFPTPVTVSDRHGKPKWTVYIPPTSQFPLSMKEYSNMCDKCQEVASHVRELRGQSHLSRQTPHDYYYEDPKLMMLWTAYGLAQKEKRAFFIEDSRWAYGRYMDIFKSSPVQNCRPPPRYQMLPCPRNAKHLVVSAATSREVFGNSFAAKYENTKRTDINRERGVYDLARVGYEALFHLNDDDQPYVRGRVKDLRARASVPQGNYNDGTIIGVHVRQGDVHPFEYQYNGAYIPLDLYAQKSKELIEERHNSSTPLGGEDVVAKQYSFMVVASDNPDVYEADEFKNAFRAQEQIKLAGKQDAETVVSDPSMMHKFVDEAFGWEGGFFASMFWNLGRTTLHNADALDEVSQEPETPSADAMRLRGLIARAYMMDLAVLGEASDTVICTMSAMGCRLLAVMMGWDKAMAHGNWINIDGDFMWTGVTL